MEVIGELHAPAVLLPERKSPVPIVQEDVWAKIGLNAIKGSEND
jgi:hypothetical protein